MRMRERFMGLTTLFLAVAIAGCGGGGDDAPPASAPTVRSSIPANLATGVAVDSALAVTFSEAMDPASISAATFTVTGAAAAPVVGTVTYTGVTATFRPTSVLANGTLFTAAITTGAKDLAGTALAARYTWSFTTAVALDTAAPTVAATVPLPGATGVPDAVAIKATFSEAMAPLTITSSTFTVTSAGVPVAGSVLFNAATRVATFQPAAPLPDATYQATVKGGAGGVTDLAGNPLASDRTWTFTTGARVGLPPVLLGSAANYVILAKTAVSTVPPSVVTGDVALSPAAATFITGFSLTADATNVFSTSPQVTGNVYAADYAVPTPSNLTTAVSDMETAYTDAAGRPTPDFLELGTGAIGGLTLSPGLYKWTSTVTIPTDVTITGSATDVWIFQTSGDLTMSNATNVFLSGGALAKNIFWQVAGTVAIGTTAHFEGIILSQTGITLETGASMNGRALAQSAVTLQSATVTQPAP